MSKSLSQKELIVAYSDQMIELRKRLFTIKGITGNTLDTKILPIPIQAEIIALNFRRICEIIVLSNLIINVEEYSKRRETFSTDWRIKDIIKEIKKVNPKFYPTPIAREFNHTVQRYFEFPDDSEALKLEELIDSYNYYSNIIHHPNPFNRKDFDFPEFQLMLNSFGQKVVALMENHQVFLPNGIEYVRAVWQEYPNVSTYFFQLASKDETEQQQIQIITDILRSEQTTDKEINQVNQVFTLAHLIRAWELLRALGFDTVALRADFERYYKTHGDLSETKCFLVWGVEVLQPLMNERLKRAGDDPTFYAIMNHLLRSITGKGSI